MLAQERELEGKRKEMAQIIDAANEAYAARCVCMRTAPCLARPRARAADFQREACAVSRAHAAPARLPTSPPRDSRALASLGRWRAPGAMERARAAC